MKTALYIARRYFFSKKSQNVINITSAISVLGIFISTAAMIIVMSGLNGIVQLIETVYDSFDPDIELHPSVGKTFDTRNVNWEEIRDVEGVEYAYSTIEEITMVQYNENYAFATMKGVDLDFYQTDLISKDKFMGRMIPNEGEEMSILGRGVYDQLRVSFADFEKLTVYGLLRDEKLKVNNASAFKPETIYVEGVFDINPEFNNKYFIVPMSFANRLLEYESSRTKIEIVVVEGADQNRIKEQVLEIVGSGFEGRTRYEQNELIFKTNEAEKWMVFLILGFIMLISTFNIIASLTMLIIDKKKDIKTLISLGADRNMIKQIFVLQGLMINFLGAFLGVVVGFIVCWGQIKFHWIKMENSIVDYWPVDIVISDIMVILATVVVIGVLSSYLPVRYLVKKHFSSMFER
ncbi:MAG: lipoprotein-releasing system permease protein [Flavobacteriales bacterium]|jgi:lipoprotein-releasing system permease protein